jgi:hypothetical protein
MTRINRSIFEQINFDSGLPAGLAMVVHRFEQPGEYEVSFVRDDQVTDRVPLMVIGETGDEKSFEEGPQHGRGTETPPVQVTIELGEARRDLLEPPLGELEQPYLVRAGGYTAFTAARKEDSSIIVVQRKEDSGKGDSFDSRRLSDGDIFVTTMLRPGTYSLKNILNGAEGKIRVAYPVVGKERYRPPAPLSVECTAKGFYPAAIDLKPAQGIMFRVQTPARIQIELVEPDDGPEGPRPPKVSGWRKPQGEQPVDKGK